MFVYLSQTENWTTEGLSDEGVHLVQGKQTHSTLRTSKLSQPTLLTCLYSHTYIFTLKNNVHV